MIAVTQPETRRAGECWLWGATPIRGEPTIALEEIDADEVVAAIGAATHDEDRRAA